MKDTHQGSRAQIVTDVRASFEATTEALEASARRAAFRERQFSQGRATESTVSVRNTQRESGMQSRVRHEWHSNGEIVEVPLIRPYKGNPHNLGPDNLGWAWMPKGYKALQAAIAANARPELCVCAMCGEQFIPKRSDAKTCSSACRQKAYRLRNAEAAK